MKNRKRIVTVFLLIAVLCLGVGYAALADDLYIAGKVSVDVDGNGAGEADDNNEDVTPFESEFSTKVYFENSSASTGVTAEIGADKNSQAADKLTITVGDEVLTYKGASTTVTVDIVNDSEDYNVTVDPTQMSDVTENFEVECKWTTNTDDNKITTSEDRQNLTITITLTSTPTADIAEEAFEITFNATAEDASN